MSMTFDGMEEIMREIQRMGQRGEEAAEKALKEGTKVLQRKIAEKAPRSQQTGQHIAENIIIGAINDGKIDVGPHRDFFYAHFLEFGTSKMQAQPFIQPAFEECKNEIQTVMKAVIREELGL